MKNNISIYPFFSQKTKFIGGLDPMGIQLTSETTYATLLPGLTNLTQRYRYYSFYCWLLNEFMLKGKLTNDNSKYLEFLRKGEYLIALCSQEQFHNKGIKGISGSDYAGKKLLEITNEVNLEEGIYNEDRSTAGTYWKGTHGILATYYSGAMKNLKIIYDNDFRCLINTTKERNEKINGLKLASAFDVNLSANAKTIFLNCIEKGKATIEELKVLSSSFNLSLIPQDSDEQHLLLNLLIDHDNPLNENSTSYRRQTIQSVLEYIEKNKNFKDRAFLDSIYFGDIAFQDLPNRTLKGWYFYLFNEFWLFANTAILNSLLIDLAEHKEGWVPVSSLLEKNVIAVGSTLNVKAESSLEEVLEQLEENSERELATQIEKNKKGQSLSTALLLILQLYKTNQEQLQCLYEYGQQENLSREGNALVYFIHEFSKQKKQNFKVWCKNLLNKRIIQRHQMVALRKMGGGLQTTQKFLLEDQHIRYIDNFEPFFSSPRLEILYLFLKDLHLVEKKELTQKGKLLLKSLQQD